MRHLPIGNATSAALVSPLLTALLAKLFLAEDLSRYFAVAASLAAIGIICLAVTGDNDSRQSKHKASTVSSEIFGLGAFAVALLAMITLPLTIRISRTAHWLEIEHVNAAVAALILTPGAFICMWFLDSDHQLDIKLDLQDALILGCMSFVALCLQTRGFQLTEASIGSMMWYVQMPFSYALQWVVFQDVPSVASGLGSLCLLCAAILNVMGAKATPATSIRDLEEQGQRKNHVCSIGEQDQQPLEGRPLLAVDERNYIS
jgi:drug/metabolite transporter (DMT)-like permease